MDQHPRQRPSRTPARTLKRQSKVALSVSSKSNSGTAAARSGLRRGSCGLINRLPDTLRPLRRRLGASDGSWQDRPSLVSAAQAATMAGMVYRRSVR